MVEVATGERFILKDAGKGGKGVEGITTCYYAGSDQPAEIRQGEGKPGGKGAV